MAFWLYVAIGVIGALIALHAIWRFHEWMSRPDDDDEPPPIVDLTLWRVREGQLKAGTDVGPKIPHRG